MARVRVVFLAETYPKNMGYIGTMLPKYAARHGVEAHLVALDLPPYHYLAGVRGTYRQLAGAAAVAGGMESVDGYTAHVLGHRRVFGRIAGRGVGRMLRELEPDVVYSLAAIGWLPLQALAHCLRTRTPLFTGSHTGASMFPLAHHARPWLTAAGLACFASRWLPGRLTSLFTHTCYAPTADCAEIAARFFGVQRRKLKVVHLGVDFDVFWPVATEAAPLARRTALRAQLGFAPEDIVCVSSGKMSPAKHTLLLADAIEELRAAGLPFRGLFIGEGPERSEVERRPHSVVLDLMPYAALGDYYRAADVAAWPGTESTSMLDAAACGLPLVVSDRIYRDHVEGNGRVYRTGDAGSLVSVLHELADPVLRRELGTAGARKMFERFNWDTIAVRRLADFRAALGEAGPA